MQRGRGWKRAGGNQKLSDVVHVHRLQWAADADADRHSDAHGRSHVGESRSSAPPEPSEDTGAGLFSVRSHSRWHELFSDGPLGRLERRAE